MSNNRPTHYLKAISGEGKSSHFTTIASLWPTKDGTGFTGEIPANVTVTGRIAILAAKHDES
jgi:hypothetical protein